jgi:hypothetical protein
MNLHNEIMNIPVPKSVIHNLEHPDCKDMFSAHSYKFGHRDARHAAAELSLKAEARIEELENALSKLMDKARYTLCSSQFDELDEYLESLLNK